MYRLGIRRQFSAAHFLRGYRGSCEALHGHNWTVDVEAAATELDDVGMAWDFRKMKRALEEVLSELDHRLLNDHPHFKEKNPSAEELARFVFERLSTNVPEGVDLRLVRVYESEGTWAAYEPT